MRRWHDEYLSSLLSSGVIYRSHKLTGVQNPINILPITCQKRDFLESKSWRDTLKIMREDSNIQNILHSWIFKTWLMTKKETNF